MSAGTAVRRDPTLPLILLGIGLGGFFDGIVFHQVLQWHHLLSARIPVDTVDGLEMNTRADGALFALTWLVTVAGLVLLWRALRRGAAVRWSALVGGLLAGWGGFTVVEGIADHYLLNLHHVRVGPGQLSFDIGVLVWGTAMLAIGVFVLRRRTRDD